MPILLCREPWWLAMTPLVRRCTMSTVMGRGRRARFSLWALVACTRTVSWMLDTAGVSDIHLQPAELHLLYPSAFEGAEQGCLIYQPHT